MPLPQVPRESDTAQTFAPGRITPETLLRKQHSAFVETFLSHRRDGVHVPQAIGECFHHVRREMRRLLNQKMEPRRSICASRQTVFATALAVRGVSSINAISPMSAWARTLQHIITEADVDFPFQ